LLRFVAQLNNAELERRTGARGRSEARAILGGSRWRLSPLVLASRAHFAKAFGVTPLRLLPEIRARPALLKPVEIAHDPAR
jgi:hypothetical protein